MKLFAACGLLFSFGKMRTTKESKSSEKDSNANLTSSSRNELIPIIKQEDSQVVDARTFHQFLEVETRFNDWISRRIEEYGFVEGTDFYSVLSKSDGGRKATEYHISLDMAKELAMVERNEKGKLARKYFIEVEKRYVNSILHNPHKLAKPIELNRVGSRVLKGRTVHTITEDDVVFYKLSDVSIAFGEDRADIHRRFRDTPKYSEGKTYMKVKTSGVVSAYFVSREVLEALFGAKYGRILIPWLDGLPAENLSNSVDVVILAELNMLCAEVEPKDLRLKIFSILGKLQKGGLAV